ncbi:MAG: hypothetical protein KDF59_01595 [Nitrosomonas sp.]|nr:hypothetical protein [Nitrosomonas sp.]
MTRSVTLVLKEFAPRILEGHLKQALESRVTVDIFHSRETLAGFLVRTTCLTADGEKRYKSVIEYCWLEASRLSIVDQLAMQLVKETSLLREYHVLTLPPTLRRVRNHKPVTLSDGFQPGQFQE